MESILTSIKKLLGIEENYEQFDPEIIMLINSALMSATMIGIGPSSGFSITCSSETWEDFLGKRTDIGGVITYVWLKTRLAWDPPQMGYLVDSIAKQIQELEWRLNVQVEAGTLIPPPIA